MCSKEVIFSEMVSDLGIIVREILHGVDNTFYIRHFINYISYFLFASL